MKISTALKPCPFCGSEPEHYPDGAEEGYSLVCTGDDCPLNTFGYSTEEEAESAWNHRANESNAENMQAVALRHDDGPFAGIALTTSKSAANSCMEKKPTEVCSEGIDHEQPQGSVQHLLGQSMRGSDLQRLAMLCKPPMPNSPETPMCSSGGACGHGKKNQQPDDYSQPQYEYLSLALPVDPALPVQLYGAVDAVDARFVMRAELLLSILRAVGVILADATQSAGQSLFDQLLKEANALLCAYPHIVKEDRNPEANQMQDEA
ncbi:Lar family restriction alleviation protein [Serratia fonticola]|uniref:Lar family restriction alleviation protein n=1 Tax=Serratia fonticola TaxID=47917 RepID=UPI000E0FA04C|nr:Lar family restriction alleviation protein [Serratia fonticola]RDL25987.1 hypothetical protein DFO62_10574 [Serratia fonticola]